MDSASKRRGRRRPATCLQNCSYQQCRGKGGSGGQSKLRPRKLGTIKWMNQYGDRLGCVRYRDNPDGRRRLTTVEPIVAESPWNGRPKANDKRRVEINVRNDESGLRQQVKQARGIWRPDHRVSTLPFNKLLVPGLGGRIVASGCGERRLCHW